MGQQAVSPWYYYQGWDIDQDLLLKAIRRLKAEQLELKISPNRRSIGLLAKHLVRTRASWLHGFMGEGGADVAAIAAWDHGGAIPSTAELVHGLEVTFRAWQQCLERWTADDLAYVFKGEDDGEPYEITRQ